MLRDLFIRDFGWKFFSLLLAAVIWYTVNKIIEGPRPAAVSPDFNPVTYEGVPVSIEATGANMGQFTLNSNNVSVTVSGPPDKMEVLEENQIHAMVDLTDFDDKSKDQERRVEVSVPWGITVVNVEPALLKIIAPKK